MSGASSQEALAHAAEKWSGTSVEEKRRLHVTALSRNAVAKRLKEDALLRLLDDMATAQSPWNVSKGSDKYPLHADDVQSMLDTTEGTKRMADEWKSDSSMCFPDPSFPSEVAYNKSCLCSSLECLVKVEKDIIAEKDELVDQLSVILAPKGVKADFMKPLLITDAAGKQLLVQCTGLLKTSPMLSEFVVFNDNAGQKLTVPCCFRSPLIVHAEGRPSTLHVVSETTLCLRLARTTVGPWSFQYLTTTKAATLGDLSCLQIGDVIDITAQREANKMRERASTAMMMLRRAHRPWWQTQQTPGARIPVVKAQLKIKKPKKLKSTVIPKEGEGTKTGRQTSERASSKENHGHDQ